MKSWRQLCRLGVVAAVAAVLLATMGSVEAAIPSSGSDLGLAPIDTITVPMDGTTVQSSIALTQGVTYELEALGKATVSGVAMADAQYAWSPTYPPPHLQAHCNFTPSGVALGIGVNDPIIGSVRVPNWGVFHLSHVYVVPFVGLGAPISLNYHDCNYSDNSGTLTVEIFGPPSVTATSNP